MGLSEALVGAGRIEALDDGLSTTTEASTNECKPQTPGLQSKWCAGKQTQGNDRHAGRVTVQLPRVLAKPLNLTTPLPSSRTLGAIMRGAFNDGLRNGRHHGTPRTPRDATGRHGRQAADAKRQVQALYWVLRLMNFCSKVV